MADAFTPAAWAPGSSRPTTIPAGKMWDDSTANFVDDPNYKDPWADSQWANIDPRLKALYQKHGIAPAGAGSGFTDAAYWNNKLKEDPSYDFLGRLDKDLAGTGTDRSTGTVWGANGPPPGLDQNASDTANYAQGGANLAGLASGANPGVAPVFDVTSQGNGPGSYAWRQQQIYALQQRLANGGSR
jgi:hypothetical protein